MEGAPVVPGWGREKGAGRSRASLEAGNSWKHLSWLQSGPGVLPAIPVSPRVRAKGRGSVAFQSKVSNGRCFTWD